MKEARANCAAPTGFKYTEIGPLPNDWAAVPLAAEFDVQLGKMLDIEKNAGVGKPFIGNRAVQWGWIDTSDIGLVKLMSSELSRFRLQKGDLLVCEGGEVGRCAIWDEQLAECYFQKALHRLRPKNGYSVELLTNVLRHYSDEGFLANYVTQTSIAHLSKEKFETIPIPLPSTLQEQGAIADVLSDADALIKSLSSLLLKKRQIKQGVMQELLTGKKRLPGFVGKWAEKPLEELFQFGGGFSATRDQLSTSGHLYLHYGDIHASTKTFINVIEQDTTIPRLSISLGKISSSSLLSDGDVVFVDASEDDDGVSKHVVVANPGGVPFIAGLHTIVAKQKRDELNSVYLRYCFQAQAVKEQFKFYAVGTKVSGISKKNIAKITLPIPTRMEQLAIGEMLVALDEDISSVELKLSKAFQVKRGLMQELLTGRIRLIQSASNVIPMPVGPVAANPLSQSNHNWQINEAVIIGVLTQRFGSEKFPLPRKRRVKLMYLLHRHAEGRAEGYMKKAAGPYDPNTKYKGPEAIALKNGYVRAVHNGTYEGFVAGEKSEHAVRYFEQWYGVATLDWLERFHYRKTDDLELLATVDMAMVDLMAAGDSVDVTGVKSVIVANPEWVPKLSRALFSDDNIAGAIAECQVLFDD